MADIQHSAKASLAEIERLYSARETSGLENQPELSGATARRALSLGEPLLAYDLCIFGLRNNPSNSTLRQLQGLALARSGAREQARELLERLYQEGHRDAETLGILASIYKDRWSDSRNGLFDEESLRRSQELYTQAYQTTGGYWPGINAATLAYVLGDMDSSVPMAMQVMNECLVAERNAEASDFWRCATLAEALLLLGDPNGACQWYGKAVEAGAGLGDSASMRRNARLIAAASGCDISWLDEVLGSPIVAVFSGHMIDGIQRDVPRFPEHLTTAARLALKAHLASAGVQIGYASAASGADILFHESMIELGRETHVVLPEPPETFAIASVASDNTSHWRSRFRGVLDRATSVVIQSNSTSGDLSYAYNNWIILGLGRLRAKQLDGRVRAFALWDGVAGRPGGTCSAVRDWQGHDQEVEWLAPMMATSANWQVSSAQPVRGNITRSIGTQRIVSMLFADAVGFSKLLDSSVPAFVKYFLGTVAKVISRQDEKPLVRNTWGDGLYFCFATPRAAGRFALDLCDSVRTTDWTTFGLPATLSIRIALHCGPAHEVIDPVVEQRSFTGTHVSRAARLEPITPPGAVYSSQSFAALCECEGVKEFFCEYVGRMPLAKKFGEYPIYCLRSDPAGGHVSMSL